MARTLDRVNIIDVEATCWDVTPPAGVFNDIIEIGVVEVVLNNGKIHVDRTESIMVRPTTSVVSGFCSKLTGITQEMVMEGIPFSEACKHLEKSYNTRNRTWASYGDYDRNQFFRQTKREEVRYPFGASHINIKNFIAIANRWQKEVGVIGALKEYGMEFKGNHHRGGDDAINIARLFMKIV